MDNLCIWIIITYIHPWYQAILKRLLLLKHNWKFEKSFILNEYGWINQQEDSGIKKEGQGIEDVKEEGMEEGKENDTEEKVEGENTDSVTLSISPFIKVGLYKAYV